MPLFGSTVFPAPLSSDVVVNGGLSVPRRSLDRFSVLPANGIRHVVVMGDSVPQGTAINGTFPSGGYFDSWYDRLSRALNNAMGPLVGNGFYGLWRAGTTNPGFSQTSGEWSVSAGWTQVGDAGAADIVPFRPVLSGGAGGAAKVLTWTRPLSSTARQVTDAVTNATTTLTSATAAFVNRDVGTAIYGDGLGQGNYIANVVNGTTITLAFPASTTQSGGLLNMVGRPGVNVQRVDVVYVDATGTGIFSTSVDGGSTWQAGPAQTNPASPQLKTFTVVTNNPTDLRVRAANAAGTAVVCEIAGVVVYNVASPVTGIMVHNICLDSGTLDHGGLPATLNEGFLTGAGGDRLRLLDNAGNSANTASLQPALVIVAFSNDASTNAGTGGSPAAFTANLDTLRARLPYADFIVMNCFEQSRVDATNAAQAAFRAAVKAYCVTNNVANIDVYDAWSAAGETGFTAANADRLMDSTSSIHPSALGHSDIAGHVMRAIATLAV